MRIFISIITGIIGIMILANETHHLSLMFGSVCAIISLIFLALELRSRGY